MIECRGRFRRAPESVFRSRVPQRLAWRDLHLHLPVLARVIGQVDDCGALVARLEQRLDAEFARQLTARVQLREDSRRGLFSFGPGQLVAAHCTARRAFWDVEQRAARALHRGTPTSAASGRVLMASLARHASAAPRRPLGRGSPPEHQASRATPPVAGKQRMCRAPNASCKAMVINLKPSSRIRGGTATLSFPPRPRSQTIGPRADAELAAEAAVEVRHVAEATLESDVDDLRPFCRQPQRGLPPARSALTSCTTWAARWTLTSSHATATDPARPAHACATSGANSRNGGKRGSRNAGAAPEAPASAARRSK